MKPEFTKSDMLLAAEFGFMSCVHTIKEFKQLAKDFSNSKKQ